MAAPVGAAAASISADGGEKPEKPCSCDKTGGNCSNVTVCAFGCFVDIPAAVASKHAAAPWRATASWCHDRVQAALAIPPPLFPPRS
ncbi:MAG: hypothetical protein ACT4N4_14400 [Rhodospirillales bacterium]